MADTDHRRNTTTMRHLRWDARFATDEEAAVALAVHLRTDHGLTARAADGFRVIDRWHDDDHLAGQREKLVDEHQADPLGDGLAARLEVALGEHFYQAACRWAELDGEPVEALVRDRFVVAAQDAVAALDLVTPSQADRQPSASSSETKGGKGTSTGG